MRTDTGLVLLITQPENWYREKALLVVKAI
jgi:hypothetical protein